MPYALGTGDAFPLFQLPLQQQVRKPNWRVKVTHTLLTSNTQDDDDDDEMSNLYCCIRLMQIIFHYVEHEVARK